MSVRSVALVTVLVAGCAGEVALPVSPSSVPRRAQHEFIECIGAEYVCG